MLSKIRPKERCWIGQTLALNHSNKFNIKIGGVSSCVPCIEISRCLFGGLESQNSTKQSVTLERHVLKSKRHCGQICSQ